MRHIRQLHESVADADVRHRLPHVYVRPPPRRHWDSLHSHLYNHLKKIQGTLGYVCSFCLLHLKDIKKYKSLYIERNITVTNR